MVWHTDDPSPTDASIRVLLDATGASVIAYNATENRYLASSQTDFSTRLAEEASKLFSPTERDEQ